MKYSIFPHYGWYILPKQAVGPPVQMTNHAQGKQAKCS